MTLANGVLRVDSERTRRQILATARELVRDLGYDNVRMGDVAEQVGIVRATLYNHFASRDDLLEALCAEYLEGYLDICERIRAWATPQSTIFEVLRETVAEELRWRVANADLRDALDAARRMRKEFYVQGDRRIDEAMLAWFGEIHRASGRRKLLRKGIDVELATSASYAMIDHVVMACPVDTPARELERAADQVARLSWHALYAGDPSDAPRFATLRLKR